MKVISDVIQFLRKNGRKVRMTRSEIRRDYLHDQYVLIAPRRAKRPDSSEIVLETNGACPFCPSVLTTGNTRAHYGGTQWRIAVINNIFPAVVPTNPRAYGRQELVIETPKHTALLQDLSVSHIAGLFAVYANRVRIMKRDKKIEYIFIFKNYGAGAGASLAHAHSQVIGAGFMPPHLTDKTEREHRYQGQYGSCIYCDILTEELKGPRKIFSDWYVAVFAPYASFHAYEAWIVPRRHVDNVSQLTKNERQSIARALKAILGGIAKLTLPYNFYFHERVRDSDQHWYIKITPRGARWGGIEIGTGLIMNPVPPEDAARFYRTQF